MVYVKGLGYPLCIPLNLISFFADKKNDHFFKEPKGLPGQESINLRPPHYPYHHKNETERQERELMENGHNRIVIVHIQVQ